MKAKPKNNGEILKGAGGKSRVEGNVFHIRDGSLMNQETRQQFLNVVLSSGDLEARLVKLEQQYALLGRPSSREVRDISDREARREIAAYIDENVGDALTPVHIAEALGLDTVQTIEQCARLERQGKIDQVHGHQEEHGT